jgi:hypothetical protein
MDERILFLSQLSQEDIMQNVLGDIEISKQADKRGKNPARLAVIDLVEGISNIVDGTLLQLLVPMILLSLSPHLLVCRIPFSVSSGLPAITSAISKKESCILGTPSQSPPFRGRSQFPSPAREGLGWGHEFDRKDISENTTLLK